MVATKDVSMEPTIQSLNDDLVCGQIKIQQMWEFSVSDSHLFRIVTYIVYLFDMELYTLGLQLWHFIYRSKMLHSFYFLSMCE